MKLSSQRFTRELDPLSPWSLLNTSSLPWQPQCIFQAVYTEQSLQMLLILQLNARLEYQSMTATK
jgi:hypothetical protein